jgi:hypothetical protein
MARAELIRNVLTGLPTGADAVPFPDHPLLLRGPDILASIDGVLTAYFVFNRSMRQIVPDVVLSRLALPVGTRFILAQDTSARISDNDWSFFDEVIAQSDGEDMETVAGSSLRQDSAQAIDSVRGFHHERFSDAWATTTRRWHRKRKTPGEPTSAYGMIQGQYGTRYMDFHRGQFIFEPPQSADWRRIRPSFYSAATAAIRTDYNLGRGMPGLEEISRLTVSGNAHLALHRGWLPTRTEGNAFDVYKPFRAAAFAGFAVSGLEYFD